MKNMFIILVVSVLGSSVFANDAAPQDLKLKVEMISEGPVEFNYVEMQRLDDRQLCNNSEREGLDLTQLVALGEKIWQIVKDGQPTLNFTSQSSTAVPAAAGCAFNLTNWSVPYARTYKLSYENLYGMDVVAFTYKVIFSYGGSFQGRGAYLANVSIHPVDVSVMWGHNFDASVNIANVLNIGSAQDPVAGMELNLEWNMSNVLNDFKSRRVYFVDGRGGITEL